MAQQLLRARFSERDAPFRVLSAGTIASRGQSMPEEAELVSRRYGGRPNLVLCGSDFIEAMENELRAKGNYTLEGWTSKKATDASLADISFKGVNFQYDPTLDDMSKSKYCYVLDTRRIFPKVLQGESMKKHQPARPENKYVFYRAMTWAGGLVCTQRNCHGVYAIQ